MSINRVFLSGNLTRDGEIKTTQGGTSVLTFSLAVNERRKSPANGEWTDIPNYFDCAIFGARAEAVCGYFTKGLKITLEGRLRQSQYETNEGKRSRVSVIVDEFEFMQRREQTEQTPVFDENEIPF